MRTPLRLPSFFRSLKVLRALNILAMGLSLAAAAAGVFAHAFEANRFGLVTGVPTVLFGVLWGFALRSQAMVGRSRLRWGWLASVPLAMANGSVAGGLMFGTDPATFSATQFFFGLVLGATFGAVLWIPGLLLTLAFFGAPVARAQRLAKQGLSGEERGEGIVGIASAVLASLGLVLAILAEPHGRAWRPGLMDGLGTASLYTFSIFGMASGAAAAAVARYRTSRRKRFVSDVEAGKISGYRVDAAPEGKVLVRVTSAGEGYRVADVEEEVVELDHAGEAVREARAHVD